MNGQAYVYQTASQSNYNSSTVIQRGDNYAYINQDTEAGAGNNSSYVNQYNTGGAQNVAVVNQTANYGSNASTIGQTGYNIAAHVTQK